MGSPTRVSPAILAGVPTMVKWVGQTHVPVEVTTGWPFTASTVVRGRPDRPQRPGDRARLPALTLPVLPRTLPKFVGTAHRTAPHSSFRTVALVISAAATILFLLCLDQRAGRRQAELVLPPMAMAAGPFYFPSNCLPLESGASMF